GGVGGRGRGVFEQATGGQARWQQAVMPERVTAGRPERHPGTTSVRCVWYIDAMRVEGMFEQIRSLSAQVRNPHLRALLFSFLDDGALVPAFLRASAAKSIHHAYPGGLCEHTLSVMQLGWRACDHYPQLDRDLVTAGCLLHD